MLVCSRNNNSKRKHLSDKNISLENLQVVLLLSFFSFSVTYSFDTWVLTKT